MARLRNFFRRDYDVIKAHNDRLADSAKDQILIIRRVTRADRTEYENGQIDYWIHVVQCLKWSTAIAAQRAGVKVHAGSTSESSVTTGT